MKSQQELEKMSTQVKSDPAPPKNDKQLMIDSEESSDQMITISEKSEAEVDAVKQVTKATIEGIEKGEKASLKLRQDAKVQSEE